MTASATAAYFPAFLDLRGRAAVIIGGGEVAARKARALLRAGALVTVVAPEVVTALRELGQQGLVVHHEKRFDAHDLDGAKVAVAATNDAGVNAAVATAAEARGMLVTVADAPGDGNFIMPAIVDRGPIQVAISTGGASPVLARRIAALVGGVVSPGHARLASLAAEYREPVRCRIPDVDARRAFWERIVDGPVGLAAVEGREAEARRALETELAAAGSPG